MRAAKLCSFDHPPYTGSGCPLCAQQRDKARGSAATRGYDSEWQRFRAAYLERHPNCSAPGCTRKATDVDHIRSLRQGGRKFDEANLRPLCHPHHSSRTAREQRGSGPGVVDDFHARGFGPLGGLPQARPKLGFSP